VRPPWDSYFLKIAMLVAERSTCLRHNVGAVLVKDKRLLTTGYNGASSGVEDCAEIGECIRDTKGIPSGQRHEICRAVHAEQNVIIQAGLHGIHTGGSTLYCTHSPCIICAKMVVNAKIVKCITYAKYADEEARDFLSDSGVDLQFLEKPNDVIGSLD